MSWCVGGRLPEMERERRIVNALLICMIVSSDSMRVYSEPCVRDALNTRSPVHLEPIFLPQPSYTPCGDLRYDAAPGYVRGPMGLATVNTSHELSSGRVSFSEHARAPKYARGSRPELSYLIVWV